MAAVGLRTLRGLAARSCAASRTFHSSRIAGISLTRPMLVGSSDAANPAVSNEADAFSPAAASEIFDRASAEQLGAKLLADVTLGVKPDAEKAEIKDARIIFDMVWREVVKRHGIEKMSFPREVVWLSGAPGAGKGSMASFILKEREIPHMFEVSSLLGTPEMRKKKEAGVLIGDLEVVMACVEELIKDKYVHGVVVDGFPRTVVQAECIKLLYDKLLQMWDSCKTNPHLRHVFRRPNFSICVLYVDENESVRRQMKRGRELQSYNRMVEDTGVGNAMAVRQTDISEEAAKKRYRIFKDEVYAALQSIKDKFHFHFIMADGSPDDVAARIRQEFRYQAEHDLGDDTYELMRIVEPASSIIRNARTNMVLRLNSYATEYRDLFTQALNLINSEFMHIVKRQGLMGCAIIRSNNPLLENPVVLNMVLDVLAERGFTVVLDVVKAQVPSHIDPIVPGDPAGARIHSRVERSFIFRIEFPKPEIRYNE